jgi:hypothetical protein
MIMIIFNLNLLCWLLRHHLKAVHVDGAPGLGPFVLPTCRDKHKQSEPSQSARHPSLSPLNPHLRIALVLLLPP